MTLDAGMTGSIGASTGFRVATASVRKEGDLWERESGRLGGVGNTVAGMRFENSGSYGTFAPAYDAIVTMIWQRCSEGERCMMDIRHRLVAIADGYEAVEELRRTEMLKYHPAKRGGTQ